MYNETMLEIVICLFLVIVAAIFPLVSFMFTLGLLVDRQIWCLFGIHTYEEEEDLAEQAVVCRHCDRIKILV